MFVQVREHVFCFFFLFIAGASHKSLYHLVGRHGELLQLYVKLGLSSGLPAAKKKKIVPAM